MQYIPIRYRLTLLGIIKTPYTAKLCHNVNIIDRLCLNKEYNMLVNFRYLFLAYRSYILIVKYDT